MNQKMTLQDAALCLGKSPALLIAELQANQLAFYHKEQQAYFTHKTALQLFRFSFQPRVMVFQILKGGTGKTSLAYEFAIRASLYGAKVLCIDLDSQANLTQAFNQDAENGPVMIDYLAEGYPILDTIVEANEGIDLIPSRIENAMLDEVLRLKNSPLETVYRTPFQSLKRYYDLIVVDTPPSLGQSVAASALSSDKIIAPITPEKFSFSGLMSSMQSIDELQTVYQCEIPIQIVLNKYETHKTLSKEALQFLKADNCYRNFLLNNPVRLSEEFPKAMIEMGSIFDSLDSTTAKEDVDFLTRKLLKIGS